MSEQLHVVFGSGSLGSAVVEQCLARGHRVRVVSRSGRAPLPAGAEAARGDAADAASAREVCKGAAVVYLCAAPAYTDWPSLYPPIQAGVVEGAAAAGARLVTAENVYVYGRVDGPMTEATPWRPVSKKGELRARLNQQLLDAHQAGKVQVALGRGPDYFGPRATANTIYGEQVFPRALAGKAANVFGALDLAHTWIYVDDFARGLITLGESSQAMGQVWHLPCPPALTQRALLEIIYRLAGQPMKAQPMPGFLLAVLSWFMPIMRELREMEYQWRMAYDFRHQKFDDAFKLEVTPHETAIEKTIAWYRAAAARASG